LKDLERAVDKIDISTVVPINKARLPTLANRKYADVALEELDNILDDIEKLMKID